MPIPILVVVMLVLGSHLASPLRVYASWARAVASGVLSLTLSDQASMRRPGDAEWCHGRVVDVSFDVMGGGRGAGDGGWRGMWR